MGKLVDTDILIAELKESALHHCNNSREDSLLQRDRVIVRAQPAVEAIPKADYETRLKADMVAMLTDIQLEIQEYSGCSCSCSDGIVDDIDDVIQQKIDALRGKA